MEWQNKNSYSIQFSKASKCQNISETVHCESSSKDFMIKYAMTPLLTPHDVQREMVQSFAVLNSLGPIIVLMQLNAKVRARAVGIAQCT